MAKLLSRQHYVCRDKHVFVTTEVLSRQAYFCRDKRRVLSRQTTVLSRQIRVCRDKTFVAKKIILVAVPASDTPHPRVIFFAVFRRQSHKCLWRARRRAGDRGWEWCVKGGIAVASIDSCHLQCRPAVSRVILWKQMMFDFSPGW